MSDFLVKQPIPALIRRLALPASIGFFFHTMFNVVDTFYGGMISTEALAALSLSFPVFFLILALGTGISTAATALIGHALGERKRNEARLYAVQAVGASIVLSVILTFLGLSVAPLLLNLLGATGSYLSLALAYINVIFAGSIFFMVVYALNAALQAQGDTRSFRNFLIVGFFVNLLLDPWFMFGWLGFPALGLAGVAWATVVIEAGGSLYLLLRFLRSPLGKNVRAMLLFPQARPVRALLVQGVPASLNMMTIAIGIFVITYFIGLFGQAGVAAYGIGTRIEQIILLPIIGFTVAALTLVSTNMGARRYERVREIFTHIVWYSLGIMTLGSVLMLIFARPMYELFSNDPAVVSLGVTYLRIAAGITWAYALLFVSVSTLQGMKRPLYAVWIGLTRQIVLPFIIFSILIYGFGVGVEGIFWGIFGITWAAALVTVGYIRRALRQLPRS